jgi:hypothetical protein
MPRLSDVFNTRRMGTHFETPYYNQDLSRRRESRYFRFTITYLFGKMDASIFKRGKQMKGMGGQEGNQDGLILNNTYFQKNYKKSPIKSRALLLYKWLVKHNNFIYIRYIIKNT